MSQHAGQSGRRAGGRGVDVLSLLVAFIIAAVLQFAAAAKVASGAKHSEQLAESRVLVSKGYEARVTPEQFDYLIPPGDLLEHGLLLDFGVAIFEFALVVLVLAFHRRRHVWLLVSLMFGGFFGYALNRAIAGEPCGCFGALWEPPQGLTVGLDAIFVGAALLIARLRGLPGRRVLIAGALSLGAAAGGYVYAMQTDPSQTAGPGETTPIKRAEQRQTEQTAAPAEPRATTEPTESTTEPAPAQTEAGSAAERLLASDLLADARAAGPNEPATYVFIWDPTCSTCMMFHPIVELEGQELEMEGSPLLRVRMLQKRTIAEEAGIPDYDWELSPTVLIIKGGELVAQFGDENVLTPSEVRDRMLNDQPLDPGA